MTEMHRKFGVEVEFKGSMSNAIAALREAHLTSMQSRHGYEGHHDSEWVVKHDGSVSAGGEMVSPPLYFDVPEQRAQVNAAIDALRLSGAQPCEQAGIHVHIDGTGMTFEQLQLVIRCFYKFEDVLYRLASSGWDRTRSAAVSYAWPLAEGQVKALIEANSLETLADAWYGERGLGTGNYRLRSHGDSSRYCGINLHSWFYRKTIEFRIFNSSLNPERVQTYIAICMALVYDAIQGNRRSVTKRYALGGMNAGTTQEANALHRFLQVCRYDAGLPLEDMRRITAAWKDSKPQRSFRSAWAGSRY